MIQLSYTVWFYMVWPENRLFIHWPLGLIWPASWIREYRLNLSYKICVYSIGAVAKGVFSFVCFCILTQKCEQWNDLSINYYLPPPPHTQTHSQVYDRVNYDPISALWLKSTWDNKSLIWGFRPSLASRLSSAMIILLLVCDKIQYFSWNMDLLTSLQRATVMEWTNIMLHSTMLTMQYVIYIISLILQK